jgi:superfamily II DNA helicase RecQ
MIRMRKEAGSTRKKMQQAAESHPVLKEHIMLFRKTHLLGAGLMSDAQAVEISEKLPTTLKELAAISGMGEPRAKKIGQPLLDIIKVVCL